MIDNHDQPLAGVNETSQESTPSSANINCTEIHQTLGRVMDLLTPLMNKLEKQTKHTGHVQQQMNDITDSCSSFSNVAVIHDDTNMTRIEFPKDLINNLKLINDMKLPSVGKEDASFRCDKNVFYTSSKNSIVFPETAVDHLKDALLFIGIKENDSFQVLTNVTPKSKLITAEINPGQNKNDFLVGNEKYYNIRNEAFQLLLILPSSSTVGILSAKLKLLAHPSSSSSPSRKKDTKTLLASKHRDDDEESIINNNDSHDGIGNHAGNSTHEVETTAPSTSTTAVVEGQQNNVIKDPASIDFSEVDKSSLTTTAFPLCTGQLGGYDRGSKDVIYKEPSQEAFKWLLDSPLGKRLKQAGYEHLLCGLLTPKAVEYLPMLTSEWERDTKDKCCPRVGQCCKKDQTSAQTPRDYIQEYPRNSREVLEKSFTRISRIFADLRLSSCLYFVSFEGLRDVKKSNLAVTGIILEQGFDDYTNRHYSFFGSSNSGLSSGSALFIDSSIIHLEKVVKLLGDFSKARSDGNRKFHTRIGHSIGTSLCSDVSLTTDMFFVDSSDDEKFKAGVDGTSLIEEKLFKKILLSCTKRHSYKLFKESDIDHITSFQGRVLGAKGMFQMIPSQMWHDLLSKYNLKRTIQVIVRSSCVKFSGEELIYNYFDVLSVAAGKDPVRGGPGRISRFVIQMLLKLSPSYVQPTITKYFLELYEKYLKELEEKAADRQELLNDLFGLNDDSAASVSELYIMIRTLIASGHPLDSPFLQRCIQKKLLERVNALDMNDDLNGSIPYPYCVNLKGVPDESETLKENEVFISSSYMRRILGNAKLCSLKNVLVFRYPLAHQHDIRKLVVKTWSNHEFLNSSENSIVFSKTGAPQQWMGGGDLDGDIYSILFDPNLVEQFDSNAKTFINYNHEVKKLFNGYSENSANLSYEESRKEQALYFFKRDSQTGLFYSKIEANLFCRQLVEEEEQKLAIYHTASIDEQKTNQHKDLKTLETKNMKNLIMSPKLLNNLGEDRFETKLKKLLQKYSQKFGVFGDTCDMNAFVKTYVTRFSPETENNELTIQDVDEFLNCHQQYSENYKKEYKRLLELNPKNRNNKALNKQLIPMLVKQERPNDSRAFFALEIYKTQFAPLPFDACLKKVITWMRIAHSPTYTSEERIEFCYVVCYPWIIRMDKELTLNQGEHWNHYSMIHSLYGHHL